MFSLKVLLPVFPDEDNKKCLIIISKLHAANIGLNKKVSHSKYQYKGSFFLISRQLQKKADKEKDKNKDRQDGKERSTTVNSLISFAGSFFDDCVKTSVIPKVSFVHLL